MTFAGRLWMASVAAAPALMLLASAALAQTPEAPPASTTTPSPDATPEAAATPALPPAAMPAPVDATNPAAPAAADDAAMAAMLGQDPAASSEPSLKFYGFADFNAFQYTDLSAKWKNTLPDPVSLYVGKLNVYMEGNIAPDWKSLIEVRYMFIPGGTDIAGTYTDPIANTGRYNGITPDYTDSDRAIAWGGISIQRAYLEHNFANFLSVRVGRFLTPWGIWNVDHGSPVIIGPTKPYIIGGGFFPEAQTGFDAFGSVPIGENTLGYHLTLSNGQGPTEAYRDLDNNKAIGGRLFLKLYLLGEIVVGMSGYGGTVTDQRQQIDLVAQGLVDFNYEHYRELSWAADVQWTWKDLHAQAEGAMQDQVWDNNARPVSGSGVQPDIRRLGIYGLVSYRLPWLNLMPYVIYQYYDTGWRGGFGGLASKVTAYSLGLNVRINPSVVFKFEYAHAKFGNTVPGSVFEDPLKALSSQLAWAF
jgi:hypothetical protein